MNQEELRAASESLDLGHEIEVAVLPLGRIGEALLVAEARLLQAEKLGCVRQDDPDEVGEERLEELLEELVMHSVSPFSCGGDGPGRSEAFTKSGRNLARESLAGSRFALASR